MKNNNKKLHIIILAFTLIFTFFSSKDVKAETTWEKSLGKECVYEGIANKDSGKYSGNIVTIRKLKGVRGWQQVLKYNGKTQTSAISSGDVYLSNFNNIAACPTYIKVGMELDGGNYNYNYAVEDDRFNEATHKYKETNYYENGGYKCSYNGLKFGKNHLNLSQTASTANVEIFIEAASSTKDARYVVKYSITNPVEQIKEPNGAFNSRDQKNSFEYVSNSLTWQDDSVKARFILGENCPKYVIFGAKGNNYETSGKGKEGIPHNQIYIFDEPPIDYSTITEKTTLKGSNGSGNGTIPFEILFFNSDSSIVESNKICADAAKVASSKIDNILLNSEIHKFNDLSYGEKITKKPTDVVKNIKTNTEVIKKNVQTILDNMSSICKTEKEAVVKRFNQLLEAELADFNSFIEQLNNDSTNQALADQWNSLSKDVSNSMNTLFSTDYDFGGKDTEVGCEAGAVYELIKWINENILQLVKIIVPILLILLGAIDFGRAVIENDQDAIKKATSRFTKRAIAAVAIFFIPTIVDMILKLPGLESLGGHGTCGLK